MKRKLLFFTLMILTGSLLLSCKKDVVVPTPTIVSFTPTNGVGGSSVVIAGTSFDATAANNIVKFNGIAAVVTASTTTTITTTVPTDATTGTIAVTVNGKTGNSTATFRVDALFKATMTGANESTPNPSTATGLALVTFNKETKIFTSIVTYTGITPSGGHIHKGAVGVAGPVVFAFASPLTSPISYTSAALTTEQEADLNGGLYYANLHTSAYPGGEIRGQLIKQ